MQNPTPKVNCQYGAPMGRRSGHPGAQADETYSPRCYLRRVPINSGGYDSGGAYWGLGAPLWYYEAEDAGESDISGYLRARDRESAKAKIREERGAVRFFR